MTGNVTNNTGNGVASSVTTTSSTNYAAPSQITTNALSSSMTWSGFLGLSSATGPNGDTASITYDANARPHTVTSPYGAVTTYTYNDTASPPNRIATTNGHWVKAVMDGFGRTIQTVTGYGTTTVSTVDAQYAPCGCSPLGKLSQQSQPYSPGGSDAWTTYTYDASGRTSSSVLPDGSPTSYVYQGNQVTVTDPASKWKTFTMDAFGNLASVVEPDPTLGNVTTSYTYDVMNHLTQVSMPRGSHTQTRTFNYTSSNVVGGFLLSATNPENGTVTYTYNSNNTLASKTDAKSQNFTYQYDSYNRLTSVTWTNPPPPSPAQVLRSYMYDTNTLDGTFSGSYTAGRLVAVQNAKFTPGNGSPVSWIQLVEMYGYTQAGSVSGKRLQPNESLNGSSSASRNLDAIYTYNNEGKVSSVNYPTTWSSTGSTTGPTYTYAFDSMWRPSTLTDQNSNVDVNGVTYNAANQLLSITYFGQAESRQYNSLAQLIQLTAGVTSVNYSYNFPTGTNNGKISSAYNAVTGETITYQYDSLNRLSSAAGSGWSDAYGFDSFGNLASKTPTGPAPTLSQAANSATNQIVGQGYDANGNQTSPPNSSGTLAYDAENRLTGNGVSAQYAYDSQNKRAWTGTLASGSLTSQSASLYGIDGQLLGKYSLSDLSSGFTDSATSLSVYFGGKRVAIIAGGVTTPFVQDRLGSNLSSAINPVSLYPWGEDRGTPAPNDQIKFATYTRDSATLLDYADQRYYGNAEGRFMTPDPHQGTTGGPGDPQNPQSWNPYSYGAGDPVNFNDPRGLFFEPASDGGDDGDDGWGDYWDGFPYGGCYANYDPVWGGYYGCGSAPVFSVTVTATGANGSPSYQAALRAARRAQSTEANLEDSPLCNQVLAALGMTWQGLQSAVASESFQDGTESTERMANLFTLSSLANYQAAIAMYGNETVEYYLAHQGSGAAAVSSAGGNLVFLNYQQFGGASNPTNEAILMHEALHNATGLTDAQIQAALQSFGLKVGASSQNITNLLEKDCVF
jgi:RHS repeat-associated protein